MPGPAVSRQNDIGIGVCNCHPVPQVYTTTFFECSPTHTTDGLPTATIGTIGISTCGHNTVAITGSLLVTDRGYGLHRVGDSGQNCGPYVTMTGSPNVTSE